MIDEATDPHWLHENFNKAKHHSPLAVRLGGISAGKMTTTRLIESNICYMYSHTVMVLFPVIEIKDSVVKLEMTVEMVIARAEAFKSMILGTIDMPLGMI